jgi:TolA-binding protein
MKKNLHKLLTFILLIVAPLLLPSIYIYARSPDAGLPGAFLRFGAGARSLGMGKAYVGVSDDASATYWNSAGLTQLSQKEIVALHAILFEDTIYDFVSYAHPLDRSGTLGLGIVNLHSSNFNYNTSGEDEGTFSENETAFILSYGRKVVNDLSCGIGLKLINQNFADHSDMGFGTDAGILYKPLSALSLGLNLQNMIKPKLKLKTDTDTYPLSLNLGASYKMFNDNMTLSIHAQKTEHQYFKIHYGSEYCLLHLLAFRAGIDETEITAGLGFRLGNFQIDYAYAYHDAWGKYRDLGSSHRIGLSVRFGKKEVEMAAEVMEEAVEVSSEVMEEEVGVSSESLTSDLAKGELESFRKEGRSPLEKEAGVLPKGREAPMPDLARPTLVEGEKIEAESFEVEEKPERPLLKAEVRVEIAPFEKIDRIDEKHYLTAESYFAKGDYGNAIREYELVISFSPHSELVGSAGLRKAECYYNLKNYGEALNLFSQMWESFGNSFLAPEILYGTSQSYLKQGKIEEAGSILERLTSSFPGYLREDRVNHSLGLIRYYQGKYEQALESFGKVDDVYADYYQARCLQELKRELPAQAKYKEILEKYPESELADDALYGMGETFYRMEQYDFAMKKFWDLLTSYPRSQLAPYARFMIGASRFNQENYSKAIENCEIFSRRYPETELATSIQYLLAESLRNLGRTDEAIENYRVIIASFTSLEASLSPLQTQYATEPPQSGMAKSLTEELAMLSQHKLVYLYTSMGEYQKSLEEGERFIEQYSGSPGWKDILLLKGLCLQKLGRYSEAEGAYQSVINIAPDSEVGGKALYLLGLTYYEQGDYQSLITSYKNLVTGISSPPGGWLAGAYYYIGEAYYQLGRYSEAEEMYSHIIENHPGSEMAKYAKSGLVACTTQQGKFDLALIRNREFLECYAEGDKDVDKVAKLQVANLHFNKRDYKNSLSYYRRFVEEYPRDEMVAEALYREGLSFYRLGYYSEAINTWKTIIDKKRGSKVVLQALDRAAYTSFGLGRYDEAVKLYGRLLTESPGTEQAKESQLHIAESYYNAKQYEKAIKEYEKFIETYPEDSRKEQALEGIKLCYYEKATERRPELGRAEGSSDAGLKDFVNRYPGENLAGEAYWQLGVRSFEKGEYIKAIENFQKVIVDYPHVSSAKLASYYLGEAYYALKKFAEAIKAFQNFVSGYPEDELTEIAKFHLANGLFQAGEIEESIEHYKEILEKYPDRRFASHVRLNIALAYKKLNEWKKAIEEYKNFIQHHPEEEKANFAKWQIAEISRNNGDYRQAIEFYQMVEPTREITKYEIKYRVGDCYECLGETAEAINVYQTLQELPVKSDPFRLAGLLRLAEIYEKQGRNDAAIAIYTEIDNSTEDVKWKDLAEIKLEELKPQSPLP